MNLIPNRRAQPARLRVSLEPSVRLSRRTVLVTAQSRFAKTAARIAAFGDAARERLDAIRGEVDVLQRDVLPGAKSAYDAATIGFENGKFNFLEVLDAQRTYFAAKSQYLKALAEAHRAAADIDRVLGDSTPNADKPSNQE